MQKLNDYINKVITGKKLYSIIGKMPLIKFMHDDDKHYDMEYKDGWNEDVLLFNPTGSCSEGGIYFTLLSHYSCFYKDYGKYARLVKVEDDSKIYVEQGKLKCREVWFNKKEPKEILIKKLFDEYIKYNKKHAYEIIYLNLINDSSLIDYIDPEKRTNVITNII